MEQFTHDTSLITPYWKAHCQIALRERSSLLDKNNAAQCREPKVHRKPTFHIQFIHAPKSDLACFMLWFIWPDSTVEMNSANLPFNPNLIYVNKKVIYCSIWNWEIVLVCSFTYSQLYFSQKHIFSLLKDFFLPSLHFQLCHPLFKIQVSSK